MIYEHIGFTVSDLNTSIDFYTKVLGFTLIRKTTITAYLHKDNDVLELMQAENPKKVPPPQNAKELKNLMLSGPGVFHIGFRVDNMDQALKELKASGNKIVSEPIDYTPEINFVLENLDSDKLKRVARPLKKPFWRIAKICDPDGIILEVLER